MMRELPNFESPPISEVALSVQFDPLEKLRTPHVGLIWNKMRDRFPNIEEHPPLEPTFEYFGVPLGDVPQVRLQMTESPPVPRVWFLSENGAELIQFQTDRFVHNWRKVEETDEYPRYESIRDTFKSELLSLEQTLGDEQLGRIVPNQCEVTYVNKIVSGEGWEGHGQLGRVLTVFRSTFSDDNLKEPEDANLALRFVLRNSHQDPIGRLHILARPVFRRMDDRPVLFLTLVARLRPEGENVDDIMHCLEVGRAAIVRGFASVTTPEMHKIWRRKDV